MMYTLFKDFNFIRYNEDPLFYMQKTAQLFQL